MTKPQEARANVNDTNYDYVYDFVMSNANYFSLFSDYKIL